MDFEGQDIDADFHEEHDQGVAATLRSIEAGGRHLIMQARRRVVEVLDAIDKGDFREAHDTASELTRTLSPLASAQAYIAIADGAKLVKARDLAVGMVLTDIGEISHHDVSSCPAERCEGHVSVKVGDHEMKWSGDQELYVNVADEQG